MIAERMMGTCMTKFPIFTKFTKKKQRYSSQLQLSFILIFISAHSLVLLTLVLEFSVTLLLCVWPMARFSGRSLARSFAVQANKRGNVIREHTTVKVLTGVRSASPNHFCRFLYSIRCEYEAIFHDGRGDTVTFKGYWRLALIVPAADHSAGRLFSVFTVIGNFICFVPLILTTKPNVIVLVEYGCWTKTENAVLTVQTWIIGVITISQAYSGIKTLNIRAFEPKMWRKMKKSRKTLEKHLLCPFLQRRLCDEVCTQRAKSMNGTGRTKTCA